MLVIQIMTRTQQESQQEKRRGETPEKNGKKASFVVHL
jgi:hypothetical protein